MKLSEVFAQLTYGELSQLNLGGADQGGIDASNYAAMVAHVNLGLTALYKRFLLKEGQLRVSISPGVYTYPLINLYAMSNTTPALYKFIVDTPTNPFKDDIHKIERVLTVKGYELGLNDLSDPLAVSTPSPTVLHLPTRLVAGGPDLPEELKGSLLDVYYRANHPKITYTEDINPDLVDLEMPLSHLEALLYFVASRVHNPIGLNNEFNGGNTYAAKYEQECLKLETLNLQIDQQASNTRLERNGWV